MREKKCILCGQFFYSKSSGRKICSGVCKEKYRKTNIKRSCQSCGEIFIAQKQDYYFCSLKCYGKTLSTKFETACAFCNKSFVTIPSQNAKFCSKKCFSDSCGTFEEKALRKKGRDKAYYESKREKKGIIPRNKPFLDEALNVVKFCKMCQKIKPVESFKIDAKNIPTYCKPCWYKTQKAVIKRRIENGKASLYRNNKYATDESFRKKCAERRKKYFQSLPEEKRKELGLQNCHIRRARLKNLFAVRFTKAEIIKRDGLLCYLCGKTLTYKMATLDHLIPIARGGHHKPENIKISCLRCNQSKSKKTLTEFKKYRGDYNYLKV